MEEHAWLRSALAVGLAPPGRAPEALPLLALDVDRSDPFLALDPSDPAIDTFLENPAMVYDMFGPVGRTAIRLRGPWFRVLTALVADEAWLQAAHDAGKIEVAVATFDFENTLRESTLPTGQEEALARRTLNQGVVSFVAEVTSTAMWAEPAPN